MKWRFIDSGFKTPAYNMALDEAILTSVGKGISPPTLRFYGWSPPALSLGYFQNSDKEVDFQGLKENGVTLVRRLTGGRAVLHEHELTYSISIPESYENIPKSVNESYKILSIGLLEGLKILGIDADISPGKALKRKDMTTSACFDAPSSYELVTGGKKLIGSAQVRKMGTILQHGSILNHHNDDKLFSCLKFADEVKRTRVKEYFARKATTIKEQRGSEANWEELCTGFHQGFTKGLGIQLEKQDILPNELEMLERLTDKYSSDVWNLGRAK